MDGLVTGAGPLPPLRGELELLPGRRARDGAPRWLIFDPLRNAYFQLAQEWFELLRHWRADPDELRRAVLERTGNSPSLDAVQALHRFLHDNELLLTHGEEATATLCQRARDRERGTLSRLMHGYLFWRVPLFRPDPFLRLTFPLVVAIWKPVSWQQHREESTGSSKTWLVAMRDYRFV